MLWWWWWIVFVVWLTNEGRLALFPATTIVRDPQLTIRVWTCVEPELRLSWMKLCSRDNHYTRFILFSWENNFLCLFILVNIRRRFPIVCPFWNYLRYTSFNWQPIWWLSMKSSCMPVLKLPEVHQL